MCSANLTPYCLSKMETTRRIRLPIPSIFPSLPCSRGAASVYDLIEDKNCLHEAGQSEISSIRSKPSFSNKELKPTPSTPALTLILVPQRAQPADWPRVMWLISIPTLTTEKLNFSLRTSPPARTQASSGAEKRNT